MIQNSSSIKPKTVTPPEKDALTKAAIEYEKYKQKMINEPSLVEQHFIEAIQKSKQIDLKRDRGGIE